MRSLVEPTLIGWILFTVALFWLVPARRAILISYVAGWLFLPCAAIKVAGLPDTGKAGVLAYACTIGVLACDLRRVLAFRPTFWDLPLIVWCLCPFLSSMSNGLGPYDGMSVVWGQVLVWGIPYSLGRIYFNDLKALRELMIAIFVGGVIYVPLCLYEIRMSPSLHAGLYGFQQHRFGQTKRFGGFRPMIFLQHGLMLGLWMTTATLCALHLWKAGGLQKWWGISMSFWVGLLYVVTIACKSTGAIVLLVVGTALFWLNRRLNTVVGTIAVCLIAPLYMVARTSADWSGGNVVAMVAQVSQERADSLRYRMNSEDLLIDHARKRLTFGWGGWSRSHVFDERGKDLTVLDGLWIAALGQKGVVGLLALTGLILLPALLWMRVPRRIRTLPLAVAGQATSLVLPLYMLDCLANAMVNPVYSVAAGGLMTVVLSICARTSDRNMGVRVRGARLPYQIAAAKHYYEQ